MSQALPNFEPSPEEVIELLQRLKTKNELRHHYFGGVAAGLVLGLVLSLMGFAAAVGKPSSLALLYVGLFLLAGGTIGVCYLALPYEVMRIARRLEMSTDPNTVPPLLDALETALQVSANNNAVKQLRRTLSVLLSRLSVDDSVVLTHENWETLRKHLTRHFLFRIDPDELALTFSTLDLITRRRDTRFIATISNISFPYGDTGTKLREMVWECLAVLDKQKRKEDESKMLLRASQPKNQSETLLRPAGYTDTTQAQELLRANNGSPPQ
jgi:hypothetical protein